MWALALQQQVKGVWQTIAAPAASFTQVVRLTAPGSFPPDPRARPPDRC
jgi:hypothetical protein